MNTFINKNLLLLFLLAVLCLAGLPSATGQIALVGNLNTDAATSATTSTGTLSLPRPPSLAADNIIFANILQSNAGSAAMANASSSGWTVIDGRELERRGTEVWQVTLLYKIATPADVTVTSFNFTLSGNATGAAGITMALSGVDKNNPFDPPAGQFNLRNADNLEATALTTTTPGVGLLLFGVNGDDENFTNNDWITTAANLPEVIDVVFNTPSIADIAVGGAFAINPNVGNTGIGTATMAGNDNDPNGLILIALRAGLTITTDAINGTAFCQGATVTVPYTVSGTFNTGNVFTAQLSDAAGSFATPVNIGTVTAVGSGSITATIPVAQTPGTAYRIRVIGSDPVVTGTDNGTNLTVNALPTVTCPNNQSVCVNAAAFTLTGATPVGGTYSGTGVSGGTFTPATAGVGTHTITYTATNANNCSNTCTFTI
ncbi:MAG: HYR domain-containing protein, partial [Saprospiraceae bacterium]